MKTKTYISKIRDSGIGGQGVIVSEETTPDVPMSSSFVFKEDYSLFHVCKHSPDGFNWGYGGSGPADLALSILTDYFGAGSEQVRHYQNFKFKVVSGLPQGKGFTLRGDEIDQWWKEFVENEMVE